MDNVTDNWVKEGSKKNLVFCKNVGEMVDKPCKEKEWTLKSNKGKGTSRKTWRNIRP